MKWKRFTLGVAAVLAAALLTPLVPQAPAQAYAPTSSALYQLPANERCLKGRGNCVIYAKSAELANGRLVTAFEKATVTPYAAPDTAGGAIGGTMPIWKSDDSGTSWQYLSDVASPAAMTTDPALDKYSSNWGSPYLYVLPQAVGDLPQGTLLLATVVTGEDEYYREQKRRDPNWIPSNDGDRRDMAIALYRSSDNGASWSFLNIVATGGWQGGSAGAGGVNISAANSTRQVDPVWEPHIIVRNNRIVTYYSDENDYVGYDTTTGVPVIAPDNATGRDDQGQILVHKTWDGRSAGWSQPIVDVAGDGFSFNGGQRIGGGRPGMTTVAPTTDGKWMMTFEYFGGGDTVRYKIADDPERFFTDGDPNGREITGLPVDQGSRRLAIGGSPVLAPLPDGRIAFNASGSGSIWVSDGSSSSPWTEFQTNAAAGYTRTLQTVRSTGRVIILQSTWGGASTEPFIRYSEVDLGFSAAQYSQIVNRKTGQVIGTNNSTNDANLGNANVPDVRLETAGAASNTATQAWRLTPKPNGTVAITNKSGGRAAGIWTAKATSGQKIGQWVDDTEAGIWRVVDNGNGTVRFQSTASPDLFLTGAATDAPLDLRPTAADGSQDWQLVPEATGANTIRNSATGKCADAWNFQVADQSAVNQFVCGPATNQRWSVRAAGGNNVQIVSVLSGKCLEIAANSTAQGVRATQYSCNGGGNQLWTRTAAAGGTFTFQNVTSGLCLEIGSSAGDDGRPLTQWSCNGGANQRWTLGS